MLASSSSSPKRALHLPCSIWVEIIGRLPLKTLIQCRYVCKSWRSFFKEPYFHTLWSRYMSTSLILRVKGCSIQSLKQMLILESGSDMRRLRFIGDDVRPRNQDLIHLLGPVFEFQLGNSCNGLVCVRDRTTREPILVWNPVMGQVVILPKPVNTSDGKVVAGFGFCGRTSIYKVVRIFHKSLDSPHRWRVEIYDLGVGDMWREIRGAPFPIPSRIPGFYTNHCIHWILDYDEYSSNDSKLGLICCFDFMEESFKIVPAPPIFSIDDKDKYRWSNIGIIGSCLSISAVDAKMFRADVQVWVMEEYGVSESWTLKMSIRDPSIEWWDPYKWIQVINIVKNEDVLILCAHRDALVYSLRERQFLKVEGLEFPAVAHFPSIVSLEDVVGSDKGTGSLKVCYL